MRDSGVKIEVQWHESYDTSYWTGFEDPEEIRRHREFMAPYEGRYEAVLSVARDYIYKNIGEDLGPEFDMDTLKPEERSKLENLFDETVPFGIEEFVWQDAVEASELLLISMLIRAAKEAEGGQLYLSGDEWGELTFERKDINPNGETDEEWLEEVSGETYETRQKRVIGYCAFKIIESGAFKEPQKLAFRGEVATIQSYR